MELSVDEKYEVEKNRVVKILQSKEGPLELEEHVEEYKKTFKSELGTWKLHFVTCEAFLKMGCGAEVRETRVTLAKNSSVTLNPTSSQSMVRYLTRPQFSLFFGFSDERGKGVTYRVWRFKVDSAIQEGLHSHEVIAEQIRKSLQGEAKTKIVGFGPGALVEEILEKLDQFYGDQGAAVGDELLSRAYNFRQQESEEMSAFASRLDNQICKAKNHGAELLPDEEAVDRHPRLLFWQGLKESMKDKARHKKDSCKTFVDLISAARYGEKEARLAQFSRRVVHQNMIYGTEVPQSDGLPKRLSQVCSAMAREVREALQPLMNSRSVATGGNVPGSSVSSGYGMDSLELPTCYRCGQKGHLRRGCRNPPIGSNSFEQSGNGNGPLMRGSQRQ